MKDDAGDVEQLTVFWSELGQSPESEEDAEALLVSMQAEIASAANARPYVAEAEAMIVRSIPAVAAAVEEGLLKCSTEEAARRVRHRAFCRAAGAAAVVRGVLNDPDERPEMQKEIVRRRARKAGLL